MDVTPLKIPDVVLLTPRRFEDDRGWFQETWNARTLERAGIALDFVQDNQSLSRRAGTVRGLHLQVAPHAQAKLVRVLVGAVIDVAVDLRAGSPTYGRWVAAELSAENRLSLLIPAGCAHGFQTLTADCELLYLHSAAYAPEAEDGVHHASPALGIAWPAPVAALSERDAALPPFGPAFAPVEVRP